MSRATRFLGTVMVAWVGVRAISLGLVPGTEALAFDLPSVGRPAASPSPEPSPTIPPIVPTQFAPIDPVQSAALPPGAVGGPAYPPQAYGYYPAYPPRPLAYPYPVYVQAVAPAAARSEPVVPLARLPAITQVSLPPYFNPVPASAPVALDLPPVRQSTPAAGPARPARAFDRWELSAWALMRSRAGPASLASVGMLGGSQAGSRLLWRFDRRLAVSARVSTPLQTPRRATDLALGVRYQPFLSIPVAITAERRQGIGKGAGQSGFALFAEGGVYQKRLVGRVSLDAYLQAGMVSPRDRLWFVDGGATLTQPVWRNLSFGVGAWGAAQPGLSRFEVGPRLTLKMGKGMRIHADYRAKLLGSAEPGSGAVVTLAGDF